MIKEYDNFKLYDVKSVKRGYNYFIKMLYEC